MLFDLANFTYWILLGIGICLFLLVIFAGADEDLDFDTDADIDLDGEVDFSSLQFLGLLGFGKTPVILLLAIDFCLWGLSGWMLNVAIASIVGKIPTAFFGLGGVILIGSLGFSLTVGSMIARPIGQIFAAFGEDTSSDRLVGCVGVVTSKRVPYASEGKIGQADVRDAARNLVTVAVFLPAWAKVIPSFREEILIIEKTTDGYLVVAKNSNDEAEWLGDSREI